MVFDRILIWKLDHAAGLNHADVGHKLFVPLHDLPLALTRGRLSRYRQGIDHRVLHRLAVLIADRNRESAALAVVAIVREGRDFSKSRMDRKPQDIVDVGNSSGSCSAIRSVRSRRAMVSELWLTPNEREFVIASKL